MNIHLWNDVIESAEKRIAQGWTVYQQFNCAHCGAKQTMSVPNAFYMLGDCEECGQRTDIKRDGMNFMATMGVP
jgi:hypothetical protein